MLQNFASLSERLKALIALAVLFILFFVAQMIIRMSTYENQLKFAMMEKYQIAQKIVSSSSKHPLSDRIDTFLRINRGLILDAYATRDNTKLLEGARIRGLWKQFRNEYPGLSIMHFHDSEGKSFARMHQPDKFGDDLTDLRLMINEVRKTRKKISAYEVGRHGFSFRIAAPVIDNQDVLLGVVEFGVDQNWIRHGIQEILKDSHPHVFVKSDFFNSLNIGHPGEVVFLDYRLMADTKSDLTPYLKDTISEDSGIHEVKANGKTYIYETLDALTIKDYSGEPIAKVVVFHDATKIIERFRTAMIQGSVLSLLLLVFVGIIGVLIIGKLFGRLEKSEARYHDLNISLEKRIKEEVEKNSKQEQLLMQQSRLAAMGEMIGAIAHQWRQPLASLGGIFINLQDAYEFKKLDQKLLDHKASEAEEILDYMSKTIDDFRNFFRPSKEKVLFDIYDLTYEAIKIAHPQIKNNHIRTHLEVCYADGECQEFGAEQKPNFEHSLYAVGFPSEYKQVILNLLQNAKDAILEKSIADGIIHVKIHHSSSRIVISVCDNAGGVSEEILDRIFDPYFTTKEEGKGTGIGLYMSKMIIENNMGGSLQLQNHPEGAEFIITLEIHNG